MRGTKVWGRRARRGVWGGGGPGKVRGAEGEFIPYDFSHPEEVFKDSTSETVVGGGIDPAVLYQVVRAGQIVIVNDHPANPKIPWVTTEGILINAPPETVFGVIAKVDEYPNFMPQTDKAWTKPVSENIDHVFYELAIQILFVKVKVPYSVYHWNRPPYRVDWTMAGGEFNANLGAYEVVPVPGEPDRSMLFYTSYSLPRNEIVISLFNKIPNLDMMINLSAGTLVVEAMKKRAEEIFRKNGGDASPPKDPVSYPELIESQVPALTALTRRGKLVVIEDTNPRYYTGAILVNQPREKVFDLAADFEGMAGISKNLYMTVLERGENTAKVKIRTVVNLVIDFDTTYSVEYKLTRPERLEWTQLPGGGIQGVAGAWIFKDPGTNQSLVFNRNTSDLKSQGLAMQQLLKIEPSFELAIQASQTILVIDDLKRWAEASDEDREKMKQKK
jgi:uncharacterized membrane protein